ncbi:BatA domain-containing protein [Lysobacter sp. FW306-1B-D06B]|uniref:BatA domain-containing protein n=1 Tax=Lysobacter sp. FW306-1B-D06B TaxID=3140250 RepID=UPI00314047D9
MSLAFLIPAALAALAALLLPLLIHLARRSEQRPTEFAALRWLRQKPKPRHRIRFDEWPLLLVRLLLVALMAALLARPVLHGGESEAPYVAVVPGVDAAQVRASVPVAANARWHWLAPEFPQIDTQPAASNASISSLLRDLDAHLPPGVALTVIAPERLQGADAQRVVLSRRVDWRVVPGAMPAPAALPATRAPDLVVRHGVGAESALPYLRAAVAAWQPPGNAPVALDTAPVAQAWPGKTKHLVRLAPGTVPANVRDWTRAGGTLLLAANARLEDAPPMAALWRDEAGDALIEGAAYGHGRVLRFTRALVPQAMPALLDADFAQHLRRALEPAGPPPARVLAKAHAPADGGAVFPIAPRDVQPWLALAIALLFLVERWLATGPRRAVAP